ncbi:hypothetical protein HOY34_17880 [Xinfangfangia sp. D13-10-4-6]|nr:hypothetical protein [Pseudogemmobacter hezensis]
MIRTRLYQTALAGAFVAFGLGAALADVAGLNNVAPEAGFDNVSRAYSEMDEKYARNGAVRSLAEVRKLRIGSDKAGAVRAFGQPVSATRAGAWNFDVRLPLVGRNQLVCQVQVTFDDQERVASTTWRRPQCADLVTGAAKRG